MPEILSHDSTWAFLKFSERSTCGVIVEVMNTPLNNTSINTQHVESLYSGQVQWICTLLKMLGGWSRQFSHHREDDFNFNFRLRTVTFVCQWPLQNSLKQAAYAWLFTRRPQGKDQEEDCDIGFSIFWNLRILFFSSTITLRGLRRYFLVSKFSGYYINGQCFIVIKWTRVCDSIEAYENVACYWKHTSFEWFVQRLLNSSRFVDLQPCYALCSIV